MFAQVQLNPVFREKNLTLFVRFFIFIFIFIFIFMYRSVGLPQSLLNQVDGERPTSPVFTEAQQFVLSDVQTYFKSFFKVKFSRKHLETY